MNHPLVRLAALALVASQLQACVPLVVAGAGTAALMASDHLPLIADLRIGF